MVYGSRLGCQRPCNGFLMFANRASNATTTMNLRDLEAEHVWLQLQLLSYESGATGKQSSEHEQNA